ncbi:MAG: STAS domain-containing protein [Betaproteobacteria bacterium]|nr:STAS domain-containing protein [Betaproteobacteria bacterium]
MNLSCLETNDKLVLTLDGQLDETAASALPEKLTHLCLGKKQTHIVLDLAACQIEGVLGYGALVAFRLAPQVLLKQVIIQNALPKEQTGMKALRFEKLFKIA